MSNLSSYRKTVGVPNKPRPEQGNHPTDFLGANGYTYVGMYYVRRFSKVIRHLDIVRDDETDQYYAVRGWVGPERNDYRVAISKFNGSLD